MTLKRQRQDISTDNDIPAADEVGIEKVLRHAGRRPKEGQGGGSRKPPLQGRKTHERQLRILQRKSDGPDE